ncbi:MAG: alpha/beta hydrolase [Beijerinckiaceae bacterium]|nr:alpha/beta hydrolase [Beijerinckiaceae bacterium]MCI0735879.1 alpha/beta hydrolase [Beijerinckiaceae bacterium]
MRGLALSSARTGILACFAPAVLLVAVGLAGCAAQRGLLVPVAASAPGASEVEIIVATTRKRADPAEMFSGSRGKSNLDFADIVVSIPPDSVRQIGEVQRPSQVPGNPATDFVALKAQYETRSDALVNFRRLLRQTPGKHVLLFVHGFNNRFEDAVFRFAQIVHDSGADVVPVLFTWPSRGSVFDYGYDHESASFSRDALEDGLRFLAKDPEVKEITVLAHSMGNWVTLEALRQMAIRDGKVADKIKSVMLAAPDVDIYLAREQVYAMGPPERRPRFTLFVSQDDRALAVSRKVWGGPRLGSIDPDQEPYRSMLEREGVEVVNLTGVSSPDKLRHGTFAQNPQVVQLIGREIASGRPLTDSRVGLGERIAQTTAGAAAAAGHAAGLIVSAPMAIVDPDTRENYANQLDVFGRSVENAAAFQ